MSWLSWTILGMIAWAAFIAAVHLIVLPAMRRGPGHDARVWLLWQSARLLNRIMHRPTFSGLEHVPDHNDPGPLIVVANHTGAVDPLLVQDPCPFLIRWMMASEMMGDELAWAWKLTQVIPVDRNGRDTAPLREAIRYVKSGGVIGIFPEGRIVWPPREIRPFYDGVGLLVSRTKAPVLLVHISGTPESIRTKPSLFTRSRSRVTFLGMFDFSNESDPKAIVHQLREKFSQATGWPINDQPIPPVEELIAAGVP